MQHARVHLDFETRSAVDLKVAGVYRYAESPTTWPWGFSYRFGNTGPIYRWRPGQPDPVALLQHIAAGGIVVIHNAAFERTIWNNVIVHRICPHWPRMTIQQQDCTMSRAAAIAHPQSLDKLGDALQTPLRKDAQGHALMMKMARPRKFNADGSITWWDGPDEVERLMQYCDRDVETETHADELLPPLSPRSRHLWEFDQLMNERGVCFDMQRVVRAADLVAYAKKQNDRVMRTITDRQVPKCSNDKKIIEWLNARGVDCTSLAKGEVEEVVFKASLKMDETADAVIRLRQAAWKTSTAKYKAMTECVSWDGRIRGLENWHGASTGRKAGRLVQPQNFPRVDPDDLVLQVKIAWLNVLLNDLNVSIAEVYDHIVAVHGYLEPLELLSKALRSMIVAAKGKRLVSGDFSNIEGRVNAWIAGEFWKLQAFADYDTFVEIDGKRQRKGIDLYVLAYARSFGVDPATVGKGPKRQIGKVQELALGYQGGIGAFITMGATYGLDPYSLSGPVREVTPADQWAWTEMRYYHKGARHYDLKPKEWTALQVLVDNWRAANPAITQSWWNYQDAAIEAVAAPGNIVYPQHTRRVSYYSDQRMLWCILPSGKMLAYAAPELVEEYKEYTDKATGEVRQRLQRKVTFEGTDSRTRQWVRSSLYGGLQCENIVQAIAGEILFEAEDRVEAAGFPVILDVHDEIVCEVDDDRKDLNATYFEYLMANKSNTYDSLPVAVSAWEDYAYVK